MFELLTVILVSSVLFSFYASNKKSVDKVRKDLEDIMK